MKYHYFTMLLLLLCNQMVTGQNQYNILDDWLYYSQPNKSLYPFLCDEAFKLLDHRAEVIENCNSLEDWKRRQNHLRDVLSELIGPFPEKTPLQAKVLRKVSKKDFNIEHIIFQSQPNFYVTASLFLPKELKDNGRNPVIIYCSGHTQNGYRSDVYQLAILNLVKKGFIVFAFDPIGQGERFQYLDPVTQKTTISDEHAYISAQLFLSGNYLGKFMVWDGIRAVDYLSTRKEIDTSRIGITGRSGGGFQAAYISAFDDRILASAPENHISNYKRIFQSIGPRHGEHNPDNMFSKGIDQADFLSIRAPKPTLMITTSNDIFNIQGSKEAAKELELIYNAYEKIENFTVVEDIEKHASTRKNREAMYQFFQVYLNNPGDSKEVEVELLSDEELKVTETGQIVSSYESETVFDINLLEAKMKMKKLKDFRKSNSVSSQKKIIIQKAKELSGYKNSKIIHEPVLAGRIEEENYRVDKYFITGEGGYPIPYLLFIPQNSNEKILIYLHPLGKNMMNHASEKEAVERFVKNGYTVVIPDLIGTGETRPTGEWKGRSYTERIKNRGFKYEMWYASMVIGRSILGIRVADLIGLSKTLKGLKPKMELCAFATDEMSPILLHAAAFDETISRVALVNPCISYESVVMNRFYEPSYIENAVPSALGNFDLPDLAAALSPRKLIMVNIVDGNGEISKHKDIKEEISQIENAFSEMNVFNKFSYLNIEQYSNQIFDFFSE